MDDHQARADNRLATFRHPGQYHAVYDFLFEYYPVRPSHLRRWHPGVGVALAGKPPHAQWRYYKNDDGLTAVDTRAWWAKRGESALVIKRLLESTATNPATFDCFGLHEWAMVYKTDRPRHSLPLRLGPERTNEVVERSKLKCTHYDAYRFFTEPARPLNIRVLDRGGQSDNDQAGCVHATMDVYKWAWKLGPIVPGELFLDALDVAIEARTLDMEASPYDCRSLGLGVVAVETAEGKAEYVARQRQLADKARPLRERLVALINSARQSKL
ncbi:3-methyladenine DNA glycosylase [Corynebacterium phocae]